MPVISVTNTLFTGSRDLVENLCEILGHTLIDDREMIDKTAEKFNIPSSRLFQVMNNKPLPFNRLTRQKEMALVCLKKTLADYMSRDDYLFYGRLGYLIPPSVTQLLKVHVIADRESRLLNGRRHGSLADREIKQKILYYDKIACQWVYELTGKKSNDMTLYDLVIPTDQIDSEASVDLILEGYQFSRELPESTRNQEISDFLISTAVETALVRRGEGFSVSARNGHVTVTVDKTVLLFSRLKQELTRQLQPIEGVRSVQINTGKDYHFRMLDHSRHCKTPTRLLLDEEDRHYRLYVSDRIRNASKSLQPGIAFSQYPSRSMLF